MTFLAILRRFWPAIPVLLIALWAARLEYLRAGYKADLTTSQSGRELDRANAATATAKAETAFVVRLNAASDTYADRVASRAPIIIKSTDTVREYAKTDAGRVLCRAADRVRAIDALDADLARDPRPAGSGADPVRVDAAASPAGR